MSKDKKQGAPKGGEEKTAPPNPNPLPQLQRRPAMPAAPQQLQRRPNMPSVPRVAPRTRASPKGR
jgi:hypothetical protein